MGILDWLLSKVPILKDVFGSPKEGKGRVEANKSGIQINFLSKVENIDRHNVFVIQNNDTGNFSIGSFDEYKDDLVKLLLDQKSKGEKKTQLKSVGAVRYDFLDTTKEYEAHLTETDDVIKKMSPYLSSEYRSILNLSSYAKKAFDSGDQASGQTRKNDIGNQYGKRGRKICNLYIKGYIGEMFKNYFQDILPHLKNEEEKERCVNRILDSLIEFSEKYIFFIHSKTKTTEIIRAINDGLDEMAPYIALHSSGMNVEKTEKIYDKIKNAPKFKENYDISCEKYKKDHCPFFEVFLMSK